MSTLYLSILMCVVALYGPAIYNSYPIYYDSGVFAYVGSVINNGGYPYLDAWDHKGLWIYFYNAIGLLLGFGFSGIYIIEGILVSAATAFAAFNLSRIPSVNYNTILFCLIGLLGSYAIFFEGGNLPETIMFPIQLSFYSFFSFYYYRNLKFNGVVGNSSSALLAFLACLSIACGILTRPNNSLGVFLLSLFCFFTFDKKFKFNFILYTSLVCCVFLSYILMSGIYGEMYTNYIKYNVFYSSMELGKRFKNALLFSGMLLVSPLGLIFLRKVVVRLTSVYRKRTIPAIAYKRPSLTLIFFVVFMVDFVSQLVSGRVGNGYRHYMVIVLPSLFIFLAVNRDVFAISNGSFAKKLNKIFVSLLVLYSVALAIYIPYYYQKNLYTDVLQRDELIVKIRKYSRPIDYIFVSWADAWIYVGSERYCFTRFFYPLPVLHSNFDGRDRLKILMDDYKSNPPKLLIDWDNHLFNKSESVAELTSILAIDYSLIDSGLKYKIYSRKDHK